MKIPILVALFVFLYVGLAMISDGSIPSESDASQKAELYANMIFTDTFSDGYLRAPESISITSNSRFFFDQNSVVNESKAIFLQGLVLLCVGFAGRRILRKSNL